MCSAASPGMCTRPKHSRNLTETRQKVGLRYHVRSFPKSSLEALRRQAMPATDVGGFARRKSHAKVTTGVSRGTTSANCVGTVSEPHCGVAMRCPSCFRNGGLRSRLSFCNRLGVESVSPHQCCESCRFGKQKYAQATARPSRSRVDVHMVSPVVSERRETFTRCRTFAERTVNESVGHQDCRDRYETY